MIQNASHLEKQDNLSILSEEGLKTTLVRPFPLPQENRALFHSPTKLLTMHHLGTSFWRLLRFLATKSNMTKTDAQALYSVSSLQQYQLLRDSTVGKGSTAVVELACHYGNDNQSQVFAIKRFHSGPGQKKDGVEQWIREFDNARIMEHPNVVKTFDFARDIKDGYCLIMEYCPDGDLFTVIINGKLTMDKSNDLFKQLLEGLAYVHSRGIAHRDLKPENILIFGNVLKISDFGASDVFREPRQQTDRLSKGVYGSMSYIAPEVFRNRGYYGDKADIWSSAVIYMCMRFGGGLFNAALPTDRRYQEFTMLYTDHRHPSLNLIQPLSCRNIIYGMLHPQAHHRPSAKQVVATSWLQSIPYHQ